MLFLIHYTYVLFLCFIQKGVLIVINQMKKRERKIIPQQMY